MPAPAEPDPALETLELLAAARDINTCVSCLVGHGFVACALHLTWCQWLSQPVRSTDRE